MSLTIRPARVADADAVEAFTEATWPEHGGDYVPRVFESWVEDDEPNARTLVAAVDGRAVGLLRTVLLSATEAWCGGMRVDPDHRGRGIARELTRAGFDWARERGASVARAMVFSWNSEGLGVARATGFDPVTEFRWAHPPPASGSEPDEPVTSDAAAAWAYWRTSATREHLDDLVLDPREPWALSTLTRERVVAASDDDRLLVIAADPESGGGGSVNGVRGFAIRVRVAERIEEGTDEDGDDEGDEDDGLTRWAEYAVAAWTDTAAAAAVLDAIATDAAAVDADHTRVLIPETVQAVSDVAVARVGIADAPDFVLGADLT